MAPYNIDLHDADGALQERRRQWFPDDDAAIDYAGAIEHPHALKVWQAGRLVAHFPPIAGPSPPRL